MELRKIGFTNRQNLALNMIETKRGRSKLLSYPVELDIVPTHICNLSCTFCIKYSNNGPRNLSLEGFRKIAKILFPYVVGVGFCSGGEPLLNRNFMEFLEICKRYKILIAIRSNGTILSEKICEELMQNDYLDNFTFSFDGAKKETVESIRRGIDYEKVVNNIRMMCAVKSKFKQNRSAIQIRYAVMKKNIEELPDLIRYSSKWGVQKIIVRYLNVANDIEKKESLFYHPDLKKRVFEESVKVAKALNVQISMPELPSKDGGRSLCGFPWSFIWIDPNGTVRFCHKAWKNPIGNIFDVKKFHHLWNNKYYQLIRKTVNSDKPYFKYCSVCSIRIGYKAETSHIKDLSNGLYEFDKEYER